MSSSIIVRFLLEGTDPLTLYPTPNHNAVCEQFQGNILQECSRPAFHCRRFTSARQLQTEADAWLVHYNTRRSNRSDHMQGRTPPQMMTIRRQNKTT